MNYTEHQLADIAILMGLTLNQTVALPATVTVIAQKTEMSESQVLRHLETNAELRRYVAQQLATVL